MSILFKNAIILVKENDTYKTINNGFLGIDGKYIDYVSDKAPTKKYDEVKDYSNKLLMPGLVNNHTHSPMVLLRAIGFGANLQDWLNKYIFPLEAKLTYDQVKWASYYAILEMLASGTTSFTDMYCFPEATAQAVIESGIKANLNKYITCFDNKQTAEQSSIPLSLDFFHKYNGLADGRLKADFSIHAEYTNKAHIVREYSNLCRMNGANMHLHLQETKSESMKCLETYGKTTTQWFESLGTLNCHVSAAHCVWVDGEDCKILAKNNVSVCHNPTSNMILGSGFAPLGKFKRNNINVTLGTDGAASNNNLNMFEEMHVCLLMSDGFHLDPSFLTASEVISMATENGYKAQRRFDSGLIEVGKCADIIAIDFNKIHLYPAYDYANLIVSSVQGSDVCMTMVDGKVLYEDGNYLTLDKDLIIYNFKKSVDELLNS